MKKLLIPLLAVSGIAMASSLDMNNLYCGSLKINSATTLQQVRDNCNDEKTGEVTYGYHENLYQVKFTNTATNSKVYCDFPRNESTAFVNGCR